ncbi:2,3-bisphosphoglycerate-independent phosphoglycerate mutase [Geminicoccaceae bacterium 1502E]|nr:2,3-bisphosphoglycerate-independent phosphoglycerate mutase [Geminicoccaceae bacterium 1502E]
MSKSEPMSQSRVPGRPVVLCVLDGWGWREERRDNAVAQASTPVFDRLWRESPHCLLRTDGEKVGLPQGQFGNSEVGHMNLGAGRIVMQELPRIDRALESDELATGEPFRRFVDGAARGTRRVHILGLASPGGVHAHQRHLVALARLLAGHGFTVELHALLDGRDTPPRSGRDCLEDIARQIEPLDGVRIATVTGRYWAMDRDHRWERTRRAWEALVEASAPRAASADAAVAEAYEAGTGDEFVEPRIIGDYAGMRDGDALLCVNFRADRVRQILAALLEPGFTGFERSRTPSFAAAAGMTSYSATLDLQLITFFPPQELHHLMGEVVAAAGLRQLRMAETEKYPHVTFFFNGGEERCYEGEERIMVPSPKVATYDLEPSMSAVELTDRFCESAPGFDFVLINYANPDMVGHTGSLEAAIEAVETVDTCLGRAVEAVRAAGGLLLVTADHGNCELMRDPATGQPHTAHTLNPVPCMLVGGPDGVRLHDGCLADVAPTLLKLLHMPQPAEMTGRPLIED